MGTEMKRLSTKGGYCGDYSAGPPWCVLEKSKCANPERWSSSREMVGSPYQGHGGYCAWGSTVKEIVEDVKFGACQTPSGASRCSWAPEDCVDGETFTIPLDECVCDKVRVGGCVNNGETFCAVSEEGCDEDSTWFNVLDIVSETNTECYLCIAATKPVGTNPPIQATEAPVVSGVDPSQTEFKNPSQTEFTAVLQPNDVDEKNSSMMIAVVASVVCVLILVVGTVVIKRSRDKNRITANMPPTTTLEISGKMADDVDVVSNLDEEEFVSKEEGNFS